MTKEYIIKKGKHYSNRFLFSLFFKNKLEFIAKFDNSCLYNIDPKNMDRYDINKLFGVSTSLFHHNQSARIGWRCLDGENIELFVYVYNDGNLNMDFLKTPAVTVKPNEMFGCSIELKKKQYLIEFIKLKELRKNSSITYIVDRLNVWMPFKYLLFPYFGGNCTAPHNMKIWIEKI